MSDPNLIADLIRAGTDPELVQRVALELGRLTAEAGAIEKRRADDRARQAKRRHVTSRDESPPNGGGGGDGHVTKRDTRDTRDSPSPSPDPTPTRVVEDVDVGAHARETLPADWQPDDSDRAYLRDQGGLTAADIAIDLEGFRLAAEESTEPIRKPRSAFRAFCLSPKAPHRRQAAASPSLSVVNGAKSHADPRSHRDYLAQRNWEAIERRMAANPYYSRSG